MTVGRIFKQQNRLEQVTTTVPLPLHNSHGIRPFFAGETGGERRQTVSIQQS
jgi:hypothetical protein